MFKRRDYFTCYRVIDDRIKMYHCHAHDAIEINFLESGEVRYEVDSKEYSLKKSDVLILDAAKPHRSYLSREPFLMYGIEVQRRSPLARLLRLDNSALILSGARFLKYIFEDILYLYFSDHQSEYLDRAISYMLSRLERYKNEKGNSDTIRKFVMENYPSIHSVSDIADALHISAVHLQRQFRQTSGMTIWNFVNEVKVQNAAYLLLNTELPLSEVEEQAGFSSRQTFYANFTRRYGVPPSLYREKK